MSFLHGGTNLLTLRNWLDACDKYANDRNSSQLDTHSTAVKHKRRTRRLSFGRGRRIRRSCWIVFRQVERNALVSFSKLSKLSKARRSGIKSSADLSSPQSRLQLNRDISAGAVYRDSTKSVPTTRPVGRSKNRAPDVSPSVHRFSPMDPLLPFRHRVSSHRYTYRSIDRSIVANPCARYRDAPPRNRKQNRFFACIIISPRCKSLLRRKGIPIQANPSLG